MEGEEQMVCRHMWTMYHVIIPTLNNSFTNSSATYFYRLLQCVFLRVPYGYSDTTQQFHATLTLPYAISILSCLFNMCVIWPLLTSEGGPNLAVTGE